MILLLHTGISECFRDRGLKALYKFICLIYFTLHYIVHRIHLDDYKGSTSLHVIKILVRSLGFTHISLRNHIPKMLCIF